MTVENYASDWERGGSVGDAVQLMERRLGVQEANDRIRGRRTIVLAGVARSETLREKLERQREELATALATLTTQLARREAQLRELDRYPAEDPYRDGDALEFRKRYPGSDTAYTYLALRADDLWYVTGRTGPNGVSWAELTEWMGLGVTDVKKVGATRKTPVSW